jgi:NAD-dependent dihydropyrimidine dehydrogenase PreA subunit
MRNIISIDEEKCDGCGLCADACHEGAIRIIDGKAKLVRDDYCDGLGDCLGECPQDAITIEERMADPFDEQAVEQHLAEQGADESAPAGGCPPGGGCPGSALRDLFEETGAEETPTESDAGPSQLRNWPVQIHLLPPNAPYFDAADLLISADCAPFAVPDFHSRYLQGRVALVGCPKLDDIERYRQKLAAIFANNDIRSIEVLRMEVPCCGGLTQVVQQALGDADAAIPAAVTTVSPQGEKIDRSLIVTDEQSA